MSGLAQASSRSILNLWKIFLRFLDEVEAGDSNRFVCVVIHNIDGHGPGLRDSETQQYLAIVASIDHVNAPLCKFT